MNIKKRQYCTWDEVKAILHWMIYLTLQITAPEIKAVGDVYWQLLKRRKCPSTPAPWVSVCCWRSCSGAHGVMQGVRGVVHDGRQLGEHLPLTHLLLCGGQLTVHNRACSSDELVEFLPATTPLSPYIPRRWNFKSKTWHTSRSEFKSKL